MINLTAQFPQAGHQFVDLRIVHQADGTLAAGIYIPDINDLDIAMSASGLEIYLAKPIPQILAIVEQQLQTALASGQ